MHVEYPLPNKRQGSRVRVEFFSRDIVLHLSSTLLVSWNKGHGSNSCSTSVDTVHRPVYVVHPCQCPGTGESELFFFEWRHCLSNTLHQINVLERRKSECCSSAETLSSVCRPPSQCPGTKDKRVRVVVLQQRHRLPYVVHPVSVLEQGTKSQCCGSGAF